MELKPGYKQTEVGIIPDEWGLERLGAVGHWFSGGTPSMSNDRFWNGDIPWVSAKDMKVARLHNSILHVTEHSIGNGTRLAPRGAVLMVVRGMILAHTLPVAIAERPLAFNQDMKALVVRDDVESQFILLWLQCHALQVLSITSEATHGTKRIPSSDLFSTAIALPKLPEQRAIAGALGDVDTLIGALDRLIAKKRDLKQAAMQQLLTGQRRLPGFNVEWGTRRLCEVFSISTGKSKSAYVVTGGSYRIADMGAVSADGRLIAWKATNHSADMLKVGDLVMPKDDIGGGNIIGKVGYIDADGTYVLGDHVYCLRAKEGDPRYLAYVINGYQTNTALRKNVIGSAQLGLGRKSVNEQEITFPEHGEQTAIAVVLSEMDAELAALERRRDKTRALKQGMMQELLTGRTRLV